MQSVPRAVCIERTLAAEQSAAFSHRRPALIVKKVWTGEDKERTAQALDQGGRHAAVALKRQVDAVRSRAP
jgi:hypothetical protein